MGSQSKNAQTSHNGFSSAQLLNEILIFPASETPVQLADVAQHITALHTARKAFITTEII